MKTLTKVKLINWYTFINEEFNVYKNSLITGENGSGKSTILDAMQYVLTVGKCKFNKAASDIGSRTLESYVRCKTGKEGKEYLRTGDVTSYVVLEFFDEKTKSNQLIGVVIDAVAGGKCIRDFFQITNAKIDDITFIMDNKVLSRKQFKDTLAAQAQNSIFKDTIRDSQRLFANALGVKEKYFELVTKSLAFKAIERVYQFIVDFLLKEDFVDIDSLRKSIQEYKRIEEQLKISENECYHLESIINEYDKYETINSNLQIMEYLKEKVSELSLVNHLSDKKSTKKELEFKLNNLINKLSQLEPNYFEGMKQLNKLEFSMNEFNELKIKDELQKEVDRKQLELAKEKNKYDALLKEIKDEASIFKKLKAKNKFVEYTLNSTVNSEELYDYLVDIVEYVSTKDNEIKNSIIETSNCLDKKLALNKEKEKTLNILNNNKFSFKKEVAQLIDILKDRLCKYYGKNIEIKPLCEYLEVRDEEWRDAIEGYLNTQRFDIIIDPEYFEYALLVYEEYKTQLGIFGVGIVNVAKLKKYSDVETKNTLIEKLEAKNIYASWYVNMLLRNVICINDIKDIKNHRIAITKSVMLYKNYTIRALNPKIYQTPYIGLDAIKIQKATIESELLELKEQIKDSNDKLNNMKQIHNLLTSSNADKILYRIDIVDEYHHSLNYYSDIKARLDSIKLDPSIISLMEEYDKLDKVLKNDKKIIEEYRERSGSLKNEITRIVSDIEEKQSNLNIILKKLETYELDNAKLIQKANKKLEEYESKYAKNLAKIEKNIIYSIEQSLKNKNILGLNITIQMKEYNTMFNVGFENQLTAINDYIQKYQYLRDIDIVKKMDLARSAKLKSEESFKTSFISGLNEKIENAKRDISTLNKGLAKRNFNGEIYEFCISSTTKEEFKDYYQVIKTGKDYLANNLLSETLDYNQRKIMNQLFDKLSSVENDKETEKTLIEYIDYRNYLEYDIKIKYENGDIAYFSKVNREKSGGETQTPFYVIMAASFEQVIRERRDDEDFGCVVLFDEAFNNMDENRINEMIQFYNERDIQTFIAVPPQRANNIAPYVNTRLLTIKQDDASFIEVIRDVKL